MRGLQIINASYCRYEDFFCCNYSDRALNSDPTVASFISKRGYYKYAIRESPHLFGKFYSSPSVAPLIPVASASPGSPPSASMNHLCSSQRIEESISFPSCSAKGNQLVSCVQVQASITTPLSQYVVRTRSFDSGHCTKSKHASLLPSAYTFSETWP